MFQRHWLLPVGMENHCFWFIFPFLFFPFDAFALWKITLDHRGVGCPTGLKIIIVVIVVTVVIVVIVVIVITIAIAIVIIFI